MNWPKGLRVKIKEPLKNKTTFHIGGASRFFSQPKGRLELRQLLIAAKRNKFPVYVIGAGSNLLISDEGVNGLVIKLDSPVFKRISLKNNILAAGSGIKIGELIKFSLKHSLGGLEFLSGIPGTLGGALLMNAGCWGFNIGDIVEEIEVMDYNGRIKTLSSRKAKFTYRKSGLEKYVILSALLKLKKGRKNKIKENINKYIAGRKATQDAGSFNAGCVFKNPEKQPAGRLIDLCGLKGKKEGGAFVSERHANFIINQGKASAKDVLRLMDLIKKQVKLKFGLTLHPEIKIWR